MLEHPRHDLGAEMLRQKHALAQACMCCVYCKSPSTNTLHVLSTLSAHRVYHNPYCSPSLQPLTTQALLRWPHVDVQLGTATLARLRAYVAAGPFATTAALAVPRVADAMAM